MATADILWPPCVADADIVLWFLLLLSIFLFFLALSQSSQIGCLPYFYTMVWP